MPFDVQSIIDELRRSQEQANLANEERFGELKTLLSEGISLGEQRFTEAGELLAGQGEASRARIRKDFQEGVGGDLQSLASRGLANTTVFEGLKAQRSEDRDLALTDVDEGVARQRSGLLERMGAFQMGARESLAGAVERASDVAPYTEAFTNLLNQLAMGEAQSGRTFRFLGSSPSGGSAGGGGGGSGAGGKGRDYGGGGGRGGSGRRVGHHVNQGAPYNAPPQRIRKGPTGTGAPGPGWVLRAGYWEAPAGTPVTNPDYK